MALYGKKLHIRKDGVVTDINLWTEKSEVGAPTLAIRHAGVVVYAKLGEVTDTQASALRVRKDGIVYAALKNRWVTINIVQSANQTITVTAGEKTYTESFSVPYGTAYTATITAAAGFAPGALSSSGGTAEGDVTISATAAVTTVPTGSVNGDGDLSFAIPPGVTVVRFYVRPSSNYYVGVTSGISYTFLADWEEYEQGPAQHIRVVRVPGRELWLRDDGSGDGIINSGTLPFVISYSPEINAHGPTNGSI